MVLNNTKQVLLSNTLTFNNILYYTDFFNFGSKYCLTRLYLLAIRSVNQFSCDPQGDLTLRPLQQQICAELSILNKTQLTQFKSQCKYSAVNFKIQNGYNRNYNQYFYNQSGTQNSYVAICLITLRSYYNKKYIFSKPIKGSSNRETIILISITSSFLIFFPV